MQYASQPNLPLRTALSQAEITILSPSRNSSEAREEYFHHPLQRLRNASSVDKLRRKQLSSPVKELARQKSNAVVSFPYEQAELQKIR
jgi:hypothetical protein